MDDLNTLQPASQEMISRTFFRIYQCDNMINKRVTKVLDQYGITSQQWATLGALSGPQANDGITVGALSQFLKVSRQNLSGVLTRLEKRNLIGKTTASSDTRTRLVRLTSEGKEIWRKMEPTVHNYFNELLEDVSFDDNVAFLNRLNHLLAKLEKL